jgi:hypothetical protein
MRGAGRDGRDRHPQPEQETHMHVNRSDFTASRFLKAGDLDIPRTTARLARVTRETLKGSDGPREKLIVWFDGIDKALPLNVTNLDVLLDALGNDTARWIGRDVTIVRTRVRNPNGQLVDGIRLEVLAADDPPPFDDVPFPEE